MKVLKFGGSSVSTPDRVKNVVKILKSYYEKGDNFTVVFSAFGGVTDSLIKMSTLASEGDSDYEKLFDAFSARHIEAAQELIKAPFLDQLLPGLEKNHEVLKNLLHGIFLVREASPRTMDYVLSFGERNSAYIISHALNQEGISASYLDARKIIKTDKHFGSAKVDFSKTYSKIEQYFSQNPEIQIVTGFVASAKGGLTTTLGRGGSDYTAAILGAGLDASVIEIWTDVDGVLTADPRKVKKAFTIPDLTYAEAMEMSHFGAKVIYPPTLIPALSKNIPILIKNTFNPTFKGSTITEKGDPNGNVVKGISSIGHIALLTMQGSGLFGMPGIAGRLFSALANGGINIILITQGSSEHSISFAVDPKFTDSAREQVELEFEYEMQQGLVDPIKVEREMSVVAIIGEDMRYRPGISGRLFEALGKNGINAVAIAQGSSELNISVVINKADESKALNALHQSFFLSDTKVIHLFMIGVGLIGSTLINQIKRHKDSLLNNQSLEIKIIGLSNSKKMIFDENGIDLEQWREHLVDKGTVTNIGTFVERMKSMNLTNTIFVDNTASDQVANFYELILDASISISTPNKIATSSSFLLYQRLKKIANKRGVQFKYETNVGAGLPVLSTINDLINSGDRIMKIEGVLSGSLSYIFNNYREGDSFATIVEEAKTLGYTEPDPRVDLSGLDVRRKLVILAREVGFPLEPARVEIQPILPENCLNAKSTEAFFEELHNSDEYFSNLLSDAKSKNEVLRVIASFEDGVAKIGLIGVDSDNPFYTLSGSDNMIVFTTERYKERPLVVRGPGAGAEVTAAGVFAEIISIGNYLS